MWVPFFVAFDYAGTASGAGSVTGATTGSGVVGTGVRSRRTIRSGSPISAMFVSCLTRRVVAHGVVGG